MSWLLVPLVWALPFSHTANVHTFFVQAPGDGKALVVDKARVTPAPGSLIATFLTHVTFVSSWDCILPSPPAWPVAGRACWSYHYLLARANLAILGSSHMSPEKAGALLLHSALGATKGNPPDN